jgi:hypothetical protein
VEAARVLGERLLREFPDDLDARIATAFRRLTGRGPDPAELAILRRMHGDQLALFARDPHAAEVFLATGERPRDEALPPIEAAAMAVVAGALMNHDEFVMKR